MNKREVSVTHHMTTEMDVDRLDEWVEANIPEGRVQVLDLETGETLYDDL